MVKPLSNKNSASRNSDAQYDSGHFGMDGVVPQQSAAQRLIYNKQRIELLTTINGILLERDQNEEKTKVLQMKLKQLRENMNHRVQQINKSRKEQISTLRESGRVLESEYNVLVHQVEHAKSHLEGISHSHVTCSLPCAPDKCAPCPRTKNGPSKKANSKIVAQRLVKEITELQHRICSVENKIYREQKVRKQLDEEIRRFRMELSDYKKKRSMLNLSKAALRPLPQLSKIAVN